MQGQRIRGTSRQQTTHACRKFGAQTFTELQKTWGSGATWSGDLKHLWIDLLDDDDEGFLIKHFYYYCDVCFKFIIRLFSMETYWGRLIMCLHCSHQFSAVLHKSAHLCTYLLGILICFPWNLLWSCSNEKLHFAIEIWNAIPFSYVHTNFLGSPAGTITVEMIIHHIRRWMMVAPIVMCIKEMCVACVLDVYCKILGLQPKSTCIVIVIIIIFISIIKGAQDVSFLKFQLQY